MPGFTHHVFICGNQRAEGHPRGSCDPTASGTLRDAFKAELKRARLGPLVRANAAGCLDQCEHGPVVVIYPQAIWYGRVTADDVPRIVRETLVEGRVVEDLVIPADCLNNPMCPHRGSKS
jgi:(2Fe-2S) ferredoxin